MEPSEAVNVRISGDIADVLAQRAKALGISRQDLIDQVLRREALYGAEAWARPVEVAPGLLPLSKELADAPRTQTFAFVYRDIDSNAAVVVLGQVEQVHPTIFYVRPPGHRLVAIARANLLAWQAYKDHAELWDIIPMWFYGGARLHPTIPHQFLQNLLNPQFDGVR